MKFEKVSVGMKVQDTWYTEKWGKGVVTKKLKTRIHIDFEHYGHVVFDKTHVRNFLKKVPGSKRQKQWYERQVTKKDIKDARDFLKTFGVRMHFKPVCGGGQADYWNNLIEISPKKKRTLHAFWGIVLHELWHCLCYQQGLYKNYHYDTNGRPKTKKELQRFRRIAYKAERFVDKKAKEMMNDYFPGMPYDYGYVDKADKEWYYKNYLDKYYSIGGNK